MSKASKDSYSSPQSLNFTDICMVGAKLVPHSIQTSLKTLRIWAAQSLFFVLLQITLTLHVHYNYRPKSDYNHFKGYLQIETKFWTTAGEKPSKSSKMTTKGGWSTRLKGIWMI